MRAYRALLRLFPASFRAEYGEEMCGILAERRRAAAGVFGRAALWPGVVGDTLTSAARVHLDILLQDLRHFGRTLRHRIGFAATVVVVTALGVGATTAAFSVADHVLIRPLPFPEPERLVQLWQDQGVRGYSQVELSPANYRDYRRLSTSFEAMAAINDTSVNLIGLGSPEKLEAEAVTGELFGLLRARPLLGRVLTAEDDREGAPGAVVLSYPLWQGRFGGDPAVLGGKVVLDDAPYEIVGVMPPGFFFPSRDTELWTAMRFAAKDFEERDNLYLDCVARLKNGVSLQEAGADMALVAAQLERQYPKENAQTGARVVSLRDRVPAQSRLLLSALFGAALCVLLIACTNLASLFLARALERRKELAVRTALGAGRERLVRQLLTESLLLACAGGALGVLIAASTLPLVVRLVPNALPIEEMPRIDLRVLAFAGVMTLLTAVGFGLVPALRALRRTDAHDLREGARGGVGGGKERLRSALVVAEVTISIVLLVSSGLLLRALFRLRAVDPGFDTAGVLTLRTSLPMPKYQQTARRARFYASVLEVARGLPGVTDAAFISYLPMVMRGGIWNIEAEGQPAANPAQGSASLRYVTTGLFGALGVPLRRGRDVSDADTTGSLSVAVVSESFARRYWPGQDPLGRHFRFGLLGSTLSGPEEPFQERTVVGVVGDVKVRGLERTSEPQVYLPYLQAPDGAMEGYAPQSLVVRTKLDPLSLAPELRRIVAAADPMEPVSDLRTLASIVDGETAPRQVQVYVLGAFALVALLLAAVGLHGLLAFTVSNRAQEIGVRVALGARRFDILGLVLRHGLGLGLIGAGLGTALACAAGLGLRGLLAGVSPADPPTLLAAAAFTVVIVIGACVLPAVRALRVDPLTAIKAD